MNHSKFLESCCIFFEIIYNENQKLKGKVQGKQFNRGRLEKRGFFPCVLLALRYFKLITSDRERHIPMKANSIFHAIRHGILICNAQGRIVFFNHVYGEFIGHTLQEVRNRFVTDIRPGSHVPEVLKFHRARKWRRKPLVFLWPLFITS